MALRNKVVFSDENNNVGIGIVATQRLHVSSGGTNDVAMLLNSTDSSWHNLGILKDGSQLNIAEYNNAGDTLSEKLVTFEFSGNKVGICTDNPQALLQVKGESTLAASTGYRKTWVGGAGTWGADSYEELGVGYSGIRSIYKNGSCWDLQFTTGNSADFVNGNQSARMTITCAGNVGIGTDAPAGIGSRSLNVKASASTGADLTIEADNGTNFGVFYSGATTNDPFSIFSNTGFKFATASDKNATGYDEHMRIKSDGRVGIGTESPTSGYNLDIADSGAAGVYIRTTGSTSTASLLAIEGYVPNGSTDHAARIEARNRNSSEILTQIDSITDSVFNSGALLFKTASVGTVAERARIDSTGNLSVNHAQNTAFMNTSTAAKYIGVASNNNDALFIAHSSGQGVGYFGYDYSADRLIIATDSGAGGNSIQFSLNAGATSGGTTDNLAAATATMTICQNSKIFLEGPTQTLITSSAAREGAVINLDGNYGWEVGYVGGDYNGGILFNTSDTSGNGVGVGAAIRSMATDPYGRYSLDFHTTGNTVAEGDDALRMRIDAFGATNIYNNAAASTACTNFRVFGYDSDSRFSLGNGGGNNDITMCMTDSAGNVKVCMYGHSGNAFFEGSINTNTCVKSPILCATTQVTAPQGFFSSATIPLAIQDPGVATYYWCFPGDNDVYFQPNTTSTKTLTFRNDGTGSMNVCAEGCFKSPIVCAVTCVRSNVLCAYQAAAGLGCTLLARFSAVNTTPNPDDNHYMVVCIDPGANVVYLTSTGASSGGFCILNCIISTCLCGTSCIKGAITCGGTCVKSPTVCGTGCVVADGELRVDRICGLNIGADSGQQVTGAGGGSVYQWGYQAGGAWTAPFPDLVIGFHTGLILGANCTYGGTRFYSDHPHNNTAQIIFLVGCGNCNVCACYDLCAAGNVIGAITCGVTCVTSDTICAGSTMQVGGNDVLTTASSVGVGFCALSDVNNRVVTANGASSLCGEANMTFDGSTLNVTGAITATGDITSTSDERVKCNITAICGAIQIVNNLCGRVFIKDNREQVGVIAQEVEKVLPQVVFEHSNNDLKSVSYGNIVGVLIEAIKEQNKRIDKLENIIQDMGYGSKK